MIGVAPIRPQTGHEIPAGLSARMPPGAQRLHHLATDWEKIQ